MSILRLPVVFVPGIHKKHEKKEKSGINQGTWDTAPIYNQFASEILHNVLNLMN